MQVRPRPVSVLPGTSGGQTGAVPGLLAGPPSSCQGAGRALSEPLHPPWAPIPDCLRDHDESAGCRAGWQEAHQAFSCPARRLSGSPPAVCAVASTCLCPCSSTSGPSACPGSVKLVLVSMAVRRALRGPIRLPEAGGMGVVSSHMPLGPHTPTVATLGSLWATRKQGCRPEHSTVFLHGIFIFDLWE